LIGRVSVREQLPDFAKDINAVVEQFGEEVFRLCWTQLIKWVALKEYFKAPVNHHVKVVRVLFKPLKFNLVV
jgi:hypothetical protein